MDSPIRSRLPSGSSVSAFIDKNRSVGAPNECWEWRGAVTKQGYGDLRIIGREHSNAHRVIWETEYKIDLPRHLVVRHRCDNTLCVNPRHLEPGTQRQNIDDKVARNRQAKGEGLAQAKLTESQVRTARELHNAGAQLKALSEIYRVATSTIHAAVTRKTWGHVI